MAEKTRYGHRDATALLVAFRHALHASELVGLRGDDIDFTTGYLRVRRAKGGETVVHPLSDKELRALRRLLRESKPSLYVFVSERGRRSRSPAISVWSLVLASAVVLIAIVDRLNTRPLASVELRASFTLTSRYSHDNRGRVDARRQLQTLVRSLSAFLGKFADGWVAIAHPGPIDVVIQIWVMRRPGDAKATGGQR